MVTGSHGYNVVHFWVPEEKKNLREGRSLHGKMMDIRKRNDGCPESRESDIKIGERFIDTFGCVERRSD